MSRRHDGFCIMHGPRAAKYKVPEFLPLFNKYGLETDDINIIKTAVSNHSQYVELRKDHPHYLVTSLLKDADALDRIRLGEGSLNIKFLRHEATLEMKDFSHSLYNKSEQSPIIGFETILGLAKDLSGLELLF